MAHPIDTRCLLYGKKLSQSTRQRGIKLYTLNDFLLLHHHQTSLSNACALTDCKQTNAYFSWISVSDMWFLSFDRYRHDGGSSQRTSDIERSHNRYRDRGTVHYYYRDRRDLLLRAQDRWETFLSSSVASNRSFFHSISINFSIQLQTVSRCDSEWNRSISTWF